MNPDFTFEFPSEAEPIVNISVRHSVPKVMYYLPKHESLRDINKYFDKEEILNFFIDFKNTLSWDMETYYDSEELTRIIIVQTMNFISYIKDYFKRINKDKKLRFIFFTEEGKSLYHKKIVPEYKDNRNSDFSSENKENYLRAVSNAVKALEQILTVIPNIFFLRGTNMEFDCIPYFFMKYLVKHEKEGGILFSCDRDHNQIALKYENFLQLDKGKFMGYGNTDKTSLLLNQGNILNRFFKKNVTEENYKILSEYLPIYRALVGDGGDNIIGVHGIGGVKAEQIILKLAKENILKPISEIREYIYNSNIDRFEKDFEENEFSIFKHNNFIITKPDKNGKDKSKTYETLISKETQYRILRNIAAMDYEVIIKMNIHKIKDYVLEKIKTNKTKNISGYVNLLVETGYIESEQAKMINWTAIYS